MEHFSEDNGRIQTFCTVFLFVESPGSRKRRIGTILALSVLLVSVVFLMNDYRLNGSNKKAVQREKSWARSGVMPDMTVSGIDVNPLLPTGGQPFQLHVFSQNIGIVPTGSYSVEVLIRDLAGRVVFRSTEHKDRRLDPGQTDAAFSASIILERYPETYTITAEIHPEGFEDSNAGNNSISRVIDVR